MPVQTEDRETEARLAPAPEPPEIRTGRGRAFALLGGGAVIAGLAIVALVIALGGDSTKSSTSSATHRAASGSGSGTATATAAPAARVAVSLSEFRVSPSSTVGRAGRVTFHVTNSGNITHEFVVLRTPHPANALPVKNGRAVETGNVGETGDLSAGASKTISLRLQPGHYALVCNLPGHYLAGQRTDFNVK